MNLDLTTVAGTDFRTVPADDWWMRATVAQAHDAAARHTAAGSARPAGATFRGIASSGAAESIGDTAGMVVDLNSLRFDLPVPVQWEHSVYVGFANRLVVDGGELFAFGTIDAEGEYYGNIRRKSREGCDWFLSFTIRSGGGRTDLVDGPVEVNARLIPGPLFVASEYRLVAISLTEAPADEDAVCVLSFPPEDR